MLPLGSLKDRADFGHVMAVHPESDESRNPSSTS